MILRVGGRIGIGLFVVMVFGCGSGTPGPKQDQCGDLRQVHTIYNGTDQPTHVPLSASQQLAIGQLRGCSGTLVKPQWVLTADHCRPSVGEQFCLGASQDLIQTCGVIDSVIEHPVKDINLLRLDRDMTQAISVTPLPVNTGTMGDEWVGRYAEAGGFGYQEDGTIGVLQYSREVIVDVSEEYVTIDGQGERGACNGDSGGPLMVVTDLGPTVVGALSNGDASCLDIDNYVRLDNISDWIVAHLGPNQGDVQCGAFNSRGRCFGDMAVHCRDGKLAVDTCGAGTTCGWNVDEDGFRCISGDDPCGGVDSFGSCDGDMAMWCVDGEPKERDCGCSGQMCVEDLEAGGATCQDDPCEGLDLLGECSGNVARWCWDNQLVTRDCSASDLSCGYVDSSIGYYCIP